MKSGIVGSSADDTTLIECIRNAHGLAEGIIGQPLTARQVVYRFAGNGSVKQFHPYTLKPSFVSASMRTSYGEDAEAVEGITVEGPYLILPDGFRAGSLYAVTLTVGLAPAIDPDTRSDDYADEGQYRDLLEVLIDMTKHMYARTAKSTSGSDRHGLTSESETTGGQTTKAKAFIVKPEEGWKQRLQRYKRLRTF